MELRFNSCGLIAGEKETGLMAALKAVWRKRRRGRQRSMNGVGGLAPGGLAGFWGLFAAWLSVSTALMWDKMARRTLSTLGEGAPRIVEVRNGGIGQQWRHLKVSLMVAGGWRLAGSASCGGLTGSALCGGGWPEGR